MESRRITLKEGSHVKGGLIQGSIPPRPEKPLQAGPAPIALRECVAVITSPDSRV